jgi:hypothetical protein
MTADTQPAGSEGGREIFGTPLLELFRRGEVPADVRMVAARGGLVPGAQEQLALLVLLSNDADGEVAAVARGTMGRIPRAALETFLARQDVPASLRSFFGRIDVEPAAVQAGNVDEPPAPTATAEDPGEEQGRESAVLRLAKLSVADRVKRAMLGTREERMILIRDTNRVVAMAVLSSPKVNDADIETFARMLNVSDDVLRAIGGVRAWTRKYPIAAALATNPKTPVAVSLPLIPRLVPSDIKALVRDRNLPEPVRAAARKQLLNNEARRK